MGWHRIGCPWLPATTKDGPDYVQVYVQTAQTPPGAPCTETVPSGPGDADQGHPSSGMGAAGWPHRDQPRSPFRLDCEDSDQAPERPERAASPYARSNNRTSEGAEACTLTALSAVMA